MLFTKNDYFKESRNRSGDLFLPLSGEVYRTPHFDMKEHQGKYMICMEIPGSDYCAIETRIENGNLFVNARIPAEQDDGTTKYFHRERRINSYKHEIMLPTDANTKSLKKEYKNGLLLFTINKKKQ